MTKKISIAIDAMGGDNSPNKTIEGIKLFLNKNRHFGFISNSHLLAFGSISLP